MLDQVLLEDYREAVRPHAEALLAHGLRYRDTPAWVRRLFALVVPVGEKAAEWADLFQPGDMTLAPLVPAGPDGWRERAALFLDHAASVGLLATRDQEIPDWLAEAACGFALALAEHAHSAALIKKGGKRG